jgi:hypothetical protein
MYNDIPMLNHIRKGPILGKLSVFRPSFFHEASMSLNSVFEIFGLTNVKTETFLWDIKNCDQNQLGKCKLQLWAKFYES